MHYRFVSCREQSTDSSFEDYNDNGEDDVKKAAQSTHRAELMKKIDFNNLTLAQKELCHARRKILSYLDRLSTYEVHRKSLSLMKCYIWTITFFLIQNI